MSAVGAWLSLARAPGSGPGGRWFKSTRPDHSFQEASRYFWFFVYSATVIFADRRFRKLVPGHSKESVDIWAETSCLRENSKRRKMLTVAELPPTQVLGAFRFIGVMRKHFGDERSTGNVHAVLPANLDSQGLVS